MLEPIDNLDNQVRIDDEMKTSYLDYAMSVIVGRALPEVRDGLKPVQRRILYAMFREGLLSTKKFSKSAGVVGEVLKKYHPHGDSAVYDALVRMAQDFNLRYPLVDGQGNFGSVDGDPAAAYRYTEARMTKLAEEHLADIDKETVNFNENFDETTTEPVVLPTRIPTLLVNGASGIAVGMATNIPPHNLNEVIDGLLMLLDRPDAPVADLMNCVKGPDFPTGGTIHGTRGIVEAYTHGHGLIKVRGRAEVEEREGDRERIIITELPYQVNKARLVEKIAELVKDKKLEGITDLRDESDRHGIRVVVDLRRGEMGQVILNQLYKHTQLETTFGINLLALVNNQPRVLNLRRILRYFLGHRRDVVVRRTRFELRKAEAREHVLQGLKIAIDNLDQVIALIRGSENPETASRGLKENFGLTQAQAQAILEMRLQRLTGLEREKILRELEEIQTEIQRLRAILADETLVSEEIRRELLEVKEKYGDERRTEISAFETDLSIEDLIPDEEMVITLTHGGYIKRTPLSLYRSQHRGGKGLTAMDTKEEDHVAHLFIASTHDTLLVFTNRGQVHWVKVYRLPESGRTARGKALVNLLQLREGERASTILNLREYPEGHYLTMVTSRGMIKRTVATAYSRPLSSGIRAIDLVEGDELIAVHLTDGLRHMVLSTEQGFAVRFEEAEARAMGRVARGVRGIRLNPGDRVVSAEVVEEGTTLLTVTEFGYGKRTAFDEYPCHHRGGKGVRTLKITAKNGAVAGTLRVNDDDEIMALSSSGKVIRTRAGALPVLGRNTQGVRVVDVSDGDRVIAIGKIMDDENGSETEENGPAEEPEAALEPQPKGRSDQREDFSANSEVESTLRREDPTREVADKETEADDAGAPESPAAGEQTTQDGDGDA